MDLIFEKKEQYFGKDAAWVSEFEVTSDFNLHVERISGGRFLVYQKTVKDGEYDLVDGLGYKDHKDVIDITLWDLVYPKYIKVVSEAEVTRAVVLPEGVAKQIAAVKTKYDGSIYEDRKALYDYFIALLQDGDDIQSIDLTLINFRGSEIPIKMNGVRKSGESVLSFWGEYENGEHWQYDMIGAENDYEFIYLD